MVSFNSAGRFGNWFMEAATCIAYALKHGLDFSFPLQDKRDRFWNPTYCHHLNAGWDNGIETIHLWEGKHEYEPLEFKEEWRNKNIIIEGYRQSEKYFKEYRNEILYLMGFPWQLKESVVGVHIRRGDYLHLTDKHILYSIEYMRKATSLFYNKGYSTFKVFSDDINWCKEEFSKPDFSAFDIQFSTNVTEIDDVVELSCCEHNINSSSTFAWAAAWMNRNPDKIVVTPEKWFVDGYALNTQNIIPPEWIKL
jgi:hypothetical protein